MEAPTAMASVVANGGLGSSVAVGTCRLGISPKGTVRGQTKSILHHHNHFLVTRSLR